MGCAEPIRLSDRGLSAGASPYSFWPPPPSSAVWLPSTTAAPTDELGAVASGLRARLVRAGYVDTRWYPIGSDYQHGFAITTRLEQLNRPLWPNPARWSSLYPLPADLRWLSFAQQPILPGSGEYRAFLIAFTDLPMATVGAAPIWNEETLMAGPDAPDRPSLPQEVEQRRLAPNHRLGVYEYLYDWDERRESGALRLAGVAPVMTTWPSALEQPRL